MRVVVDTNVVVSGLFFGGVPRAILEACEDGRLELVLSPAIFEEYLSTCERLSEARPGLRYRAALIRLLGESVAIADGEPDQPVTRDPDDDKFMICGRDAAALVVSGDRDLLDASGWAGVEVVTPRQLMDRLAGENESSR